MTTCPYCGAEAADEWGEKAHMEAEHPEIIEERLRSAGFVKDESGEWIDTLTAGDNA